MGKLSKLKGVVDQALDMSREARMQRAREMGFDTDTVYYHGTVEDFDSFDKTKINSNEPRGDYLGEAFYFSAANNPYRAERYATAPNRGGSPNIIPAYLKFENPLIIPEGGGTFRHLLDEKGLSDVDWYSKTPSEQAEQIRSWGYDSLVDKDYGQTAVFDPSNIRSVNAAFDPAKKDSSNLLASMGGAAVLGGAVLAPEDAEAGVVTKAGKQIIEAYHGSPHDIDKFSTDKIGTGEGAQAYGHGLYFADKEDVAKGYRDELSIPRDQYGSIVGGSINNHRKAMIDGVEAKAINQDVWEVADQLASRNISIDDYIADLKRKRDAPGEDNPRWVEVHNEIINQAESVADQFRGKSVEYKYPGHLYKVDIDATPDELLDWDLPLSEQPEVIKRLGIEKEAARYKEIQGRLEDMMLDDSLGAADMDSPEWDALISESNQIRRGLGYAPTDTGADIYEKMAGGMRFPEAPAASQRLQSQGIKGIRYQDGMSRGTEGGTHNYVVFDDQLITIAKKYGISTVLAGSVLAGTMTPEQAQAATGLENFTQRRAAKRDYWKQLKSTMLEGMAGVNRGLVDTLNFVGPGQVNAVLQLSGSDNRIPTFSDIPGVQQATQGGYMEPGTARDVVRTGSEFLSPL